MRYKLKNKDENFNSNRSVFSVLTGFFNLVY